MATFETDHPYQNNQNKALQITCDSTHNVAFLIMDFDTESGYDFVTLTDTDADLQILSKSLRKTYKFHIHNKRGLDQRTCLMMKFMIIRIITTMNTNQMLISFYANGSTPALHRSRFHSLRMAHKPETVLKYSLHALPSMTNLRTD